MPAQVKLAQALQWVQGGSIVLALAAERLLPLVGLDLPPSVYQVSALGQAESK